MSLKNLVCALYILVGLLFVYMTYFNNFDGPLLFRGLGWFLVIVGVLYQIFPNFNKNFLSFIDSFNIDENKYKEEEKTNTKN